VKKRAQGVGEAIRRRRRRSRRRRRHLLVVRCGGE